MKSNRDVLELGVFVAYLIFYAVMAITGHNDGNTGQVLSYGLTGLIGYWVAKAAGATGSTTTTIVAQPQAPIVSQVPSIDPVALAQAITQAVNTPAQGATNGTQIQSNGVR